jgi:sterol desaturase/sphingolipid hydroxylase (fatty acid hydroxylase superfamily)
MRAVLRLLVLVVSGLTPSCWPWAYYAPSVLDWDDTTPLEVWGLAVLCYITHGFLLEVLPLPPMQPTTHKLPLSVILPQVALNLGSCIVLAATSRCSYHISDAQACTYLIVAALGNEFIYACIHRLLHTKDLYKYHRLHHRLKAPRPLGAVYCSLVEMWLANLASFFIPLSLTRAPLQMYLIWIVSGIQTTQIHHSSKKWPWPLSVAHQPRFHDDHHRYVCRNFGNIGVLEFVLRKETRTRGR